MRSLLVGLTLACAVALAGCGDMDAGTATGVNESAVAEPLNFTGTTVDGQAFDGASLAGKPTVIWFWAPWCPTCKGQTPNISALADKYASEVNVVGVAGLSEDEAGIEAFAANTSGITNLTDSPGDIWRHFKIVEQSVYVVLDADGQIVDGGHLKDAELNDVVAGLVA